jgi:tRNA nucleotidyltransferase (CCA-adding enzyme)
MDTKVKEIANSIRRQGGRALVVGGYVRDQLLGLPPKDVDIEVYGLPMERLETTLKRFGDVHAVGRAFGILKVGGFDISVPRRDSKIGVGHKGFTVKPDPSMSIKDAARRRDFTMNSIAMDPLTSEIIDPFGGQDDLRKRIIRVTDPQTFVEDPLRILRAAQFIARFHLRPDAETLDLCKATVDALKELPGERLWEEWVKLLLKGSQPSRGVAFLQEIDANRIIAPEIHNLVDVQQDPVWHPEGDVYIHTLMVIDCAAELRTGVPEHDLPLMFGALAHDFGKAATTQFEEGRWRARGHEEAGMEPARAFLERLRAPLALVSQVSALVKDHLAPAHFAHPKSNVGPKGYRKLARRLAEAGTTMEMLYKVSSADHFGRTSPDALAKDFKHGDEFMRMARVISVDKRPEKDVVMGRHLLERDMKPSPEFGTIIKKCREVQYEKGLKDPYEILNIVLGDK